MSPPKTLVVKGGTTWARNGRNLDRKLRLPCKYATWDKQLYFLSKGRRAEDFFELKNPTASAGFGPANLGTKGQHVTSRPPKPRAEHRNDLDYSASTWKRRTLDRSELLRPETLLSRLCTLCSYVDGLSVRSKFVMPSFQLLFGCRCQTESWTVFTWSLCLCFTFRKILHYKLYSFRFYYLRVTSLRSARSVSSFHHLA